MAGLPEVGARDAHARADRGALAAVELDGLKRSAVPGERPAHGDGPRAGAVGDADREVDHRVGAVQVRDDRRRVELARPELTDRHRAVDAAEVEPGAMPGIGLHRRRIAPVGAHDERVRAGGEAHPGLEGQVGPGVARDEAPVDPHRARWLTDSKRIA